MEREDCCKDWEKNKKYVIKSFVPLGGEPLQRESMDGFVGSNDGGEMHGRERSHAGTGRWEKIWGGMKCGKGNGLG